MSADPDRHHENQSRIFLHTRTENFKLVNQLTDKLRI